MYTNTHSQIIDKVFGMVKTQQSTSNTVTRCNVSCVVGWVVKWQATETMQAQHRGYGVLGRLQPQR